ncbi:mRNA-degrading endonuclease (mRNA interferase) YafQ, toxin component of the YafQ-DinJ toxin-antitoxin module [Epsilonproteobacteria bacterium SCGC AD-311-C15]|jgi:mRNA-degrading endonuclease YafQ of YafQ-DinJ toxin-antitoxin module|nr:mRNA-degrading endonuclease (mRNA interferase) YafQ, toxin component of the YafQ-DinJ toxin-antitoxin module [Epsilonproteobacteria bacterium SCGC AD-311-C15]
MQLVKDKGYPKREIKFFKKHPDLVEKYGVVLKKLSNNSLEPSLKLHKLQGALAEFHAVSLTYEYRIILIMKIVDEQIVLVDIGTHDDVY